MCNENGRRLYSSAVSTILGSLTLGFSIKESSNTYGNVKVKGLDLSLTTSWWERLEARKQVINVKAVGEKR